jgi:hypothetical protein
LHSHRFITQIYIQYQEGKKNIEALIF